MIIWEFYGNQENECKEIKVNDNYRNKSVSQIDFIPLTGISIMLWCLHAQVELSFLSCDTGLFNKLGNGMVLYDLDQL